VADVLVSVLVTSPTSQLIFLTVTHTSTALLHAMMSHYRQESRRARQNSHRSRVGFSSALIITARCTLVQSAVLRSHVVCLSVRPSVRLSVTLVDCDHIGWNSSKIISPLVSLGCSLFATQTCRVYSKGNTPKFGPKVTHPLLI